MAKILDFFRKFLGNDPHASGTESPSAPDKGKGKGKTPEKEQDKEQFRTLNKLAPLKSSVPPVPIPVTSSVAGEAKTDETSFVCREPILNRQEQIAGYAFTLHENLQSRLQGKQDLLHKVYDDVLLRSLASLAVHSLLGHRLAFIKLSPVSLDSQLVHKLPPENSILMFTPGRQPLIPSQQQPQIDILRQKGFACGWILSKKLLNEHPGLEQLAALGDYVQFQVSDFDGMEIKTLRKSLASKRPLERGKLRLIAHELNTFEEFNLCFQAGFDMFTGPFIVNRENWHPPKSEINRLLALKLLGMLRSEEELKTIAEQITADPVMTYKLLRYLNTPAMGLQMPVLTIDKALMVLGRERCYRWLSLLLFDIKQTGFKERMLTEQALTRAFFLESLAGHGRIPDKKDELFILGLFSLLDLLIGHPLPVILEHTRLPQKIHTALLGQAGTYHNALQLAKANEEPYSNTVEQLATACGLDAKKVLHSNIEALGKAHTTMTFSEEG